MKQEKIAEFCDNMEEVVNQLYVGNVLCMILVAHDENGVIT